MVINIISEICFLSTLLGSTIMSSACSLHFLLQALILTRGGSLQLVHSLPSKWKCLFCLSVPATPDLNSFMLCIVKCSLKFMCHPFRMNTTGWHAQLLSPIVLGVPVSLGKVQIWQYPSLRVEKSMHNAGLARWNLKFYGSLLAVCVGNSVYREIEGWWF